MRFKIFIYFILSSIVTLYLGWSVVRVVRVELFIIYSQKIIKGQNIECNQYIPIKYFVGWHFKTTIFNSFSKKKKKKGLFYLFIYFLIFFVFVELRGFRPPAHRPQNLGRSTISPLLPFSYKFPDVKTAISPYP